MKRIGVGALVVALVVCIAAGFYVAKNPERRTLNDVARRNAPGKFIRLTDGVTHYDVSGPGGGRPIVLVHGFSVPYYIWDSTASALAGAGFRVIRYDEYGRGLSDRPNVDYTRDLYDRQLVQLLDSLRVTERIDLAGVSMGGLVTGTFAERHPERLRSLTLVDPVAGTNGSSLGMFGWPVLGPYLWQTVAVPRMADGQASDFVNPSRFPDWAARYREQVGYRGFGRALLSHRRFSLGLGVDSVYERVGHTSVPVLLIWGKADKTVPYERSAGVRKAIPSAEFHPIDGAAHLPILEQAHLTDSLVIAFLAKQPR
jgi:pimeloyl-ACP methyl ester carboxylesterase